MISKEIVISWFKGLSGDDRIDLMCLLLDYCLPSELRFIGTYLESAAQKDYYGFRTHESAANNPNDLTYLYPLDDITIRRRLCLYVALLHSTNRQAAAVLFGILSDFQPSGILDDEILTELSLLYTLAANHPAFSFNQKHVLRSKLKCIRLHSVSTTSDLGETISDCSTGSSLQDSDAMDSPRSSSSPTPELAKEPAANDEKHEGHLHHLIPENPPKVYVKELKVFNIQKKGESKLKHESKKKEDYEYIIEVTWSDNTTDKIHKSYEEMFDFQCKLRKMYPTKIDENGQPWKLPFLPGRIRIFNKSEHKGERTPIPDIGDYTRLFGSLPIFVRGCDHVLSFFHVNTKSKGRDKKQKSAKKEDKNKTKQDSSKKDKQNCAKSVENYTQGLKEENQSPDLIEIFAAEKTGKSEESEKPVNGIINELQEQQTSISIANKMEGKNGLARVPTMQTSTGSLTASFGDPTFHSTADPKLDLILSTPVHTHSPNIFPGSGPIHHLPLLSTSNTITTPKTFDSQHRSLISPPITPSISHHCTTNKLGWMYYCSSKDSFTVQDWLKNLRLHKYSETFRGKTFYELLKLTDKDIEKLGMTTGARRKLRVNLEILRKRGCFSSDGQMILDVLPVVTNDFVSCNGFSDSDTERMFSETDSDCGSDSLSDIYSLVQGTMRTNICRVSCYNCGSLGHVGRQCMAPNMEKRLNLGYRLQLDIGPQVLQ